mgnify:CR=1 FL=1
MDITVFAVILIQMLYFQCIKSISLIAIKLVKINFAPNSISIKVIIWRIGGGDGGVSLNWKIIWNHKNKFGKKKKNDKKTDTWTKKAQTQTEWG